MYSVVASNGQTYGPVDLDTLKNWCREGRVAASSSILDNDNGTTVRAADMAELQELLRPAQAPIPQGPAPGPQPMSVPGVTVQAQPSGQYYSPSPYGQTAGARPYVQQKSSKSKVVAFILGFFFGGLGIHRFYLGHNATGGAQLFMTILSIGLFFGGGTMAASQAGALQPGQPIPPSAMTGPMAGAGIMVLAAVGISILLSIWVLVDWILILAGVLKDADGYDLS